MKTIIEFKKFPLSVCTQIGEITDKEELINATIVEKDNGLISFLPYIDPNKIYLSQHNSSIGKTWQNHNDEFAKHVFKYEQKRIVDVGGGSGNIYKSYSKLNSKVLWKIIDLNPQVKDLEIEVIKGFFKPEYIQENDTVITSHFVEHLADLEDFLIGLRSKNPKYHIFTLPNFKKYAQNNYSATLMFEHPHYLTEDYLDYILSITGWKIIEKTYYKDHSIFFTTEPMEPKKLEIKLDCKSDIENFLSYMKKRVEEIKNIDYFYVFGAHFTYYYLLNLGIREEQIIAVVDNDKNKQGRRMYGTNTKVISSSEMPKQSKIFVEMGPYNEEIKSELKNVIFI